MPTNQLDAVPHVAIVLVEGRVNFNLGERMFSPVSAIFSIARWASR
jgi:hypothetical protein